MSIIAIYADPADMPTVIGAIEGCGVRTLLMDGGDAEENRLNAAGAAYEAGADRRRGEHAWENLSRPEKAAYALSIESEAERDTTR